MKKYILLALAIIIASSSFGGSYMFQNLLLLPIIGGISYWISRKGFIIPVLSALLLSVVVNVQDLYYCNSFSEVLSNLNGYFLMGIVMWFGIFFVLIAIGYLIVFMICYAMKSWQSKEKKDRVFAVVLYSIGIVGVLFVGIVYNGFNGNPISAIYAKSQIHKYIEETYPEYDYTIDDVTYNFKSTGYSTNGVMYVDGNERAFYIQYGNGRVYEDYYYNYVEDRVKSKELAKQAEVQIEEVLENMEISFYSVDVAISVPKKKYGDIQYDKNLVTEPLEINVYKYTEERETPEIFAQWCERIRQALVNEGYPIEVICLDSDPHFMVARLGLSIRGEDLTQPIEHITKYTGYTDYAEINGFNNLSEEEWEEAKKLNSKGEIIPDKSLSLMAMQLVQTLPVEVLEVEVYAYEDALDINVVWSGEFIGIEDFANQCVEIREVLLNNEEKLGGVPILSLHFNYLSRSDAKEWYYDCYEEDMSQDIDTIIQDIKQDEKMMEQMKYN